MKPRTMTAKPFIKTVDGVVNSAVGGRCTYTNTQRDVFVPLGCKTWK